MSRRGQPRPVGGRTAAAPRHIGSQVSIAGIIRKGSARGVGGRTAQWEAAQMSHCDLGGRPLVSVNHVDVQYPKVGRVTDGGWAGNRRQLGG